MENKKIDYLDVVNHLRGIQDVSTVYQGLPAGAPPEWIISEFIKLCAGEKSNLSTPRPDSIDHLMIEQLLKNGLVGPNLEIDPTVREAVLDYCKKDLPEYLKTPETFEEEKKMASGLPVMLSFKGLAEQNPDLLRRFLYDWSDRGAGVGWANRRVDLERTEKLELEKWRLFTHTGQNEKWVTDTIIVQKNRKGVDGDIVRLADKLLGVQQKEKRDLFEK